MSRALIRRIAVWVVIGLATLLPRILNLDAFPNSDEMNFWLDRSRTFSATIATGNYADTAISTHPGVTTMWLGSAGLLLHRSLAAWDLFHTTTFPAELACIRIPIALTHTAGVLLGYWMLRRLLPAGAAMLAALLWATDPFVIALCRMLHVDGLMTTFATLSLLAACCAWSRQAGQPVRRGFLVLSGTCAALAVLSKSPGLALLPVVGVLAVAADLLPGRNVTTPPHTPLTQRCISLVRHLLIWGGAFVVTVLLVWPATWADPARVVELLRIGVEVEGGTGHVVGNFFLGRPDPEPGLLFYPVALALRMTPWTMVGLFLLAGCMGGQADRQVAPHNLCNYQTMAVLAAFIILFTSAMSIFPQKLNRYLVPVFPSLNVLATVGLAWGAQWLAQVGVRGPGGGSRGMPWLSHGLLLICATIAIVNAAWWHPYTIAYFNQALGGARMGARTFLVGEGDGLGQVAAWLNSQPDITGVVTASTMINSLRPSMQPGAQVSSPEDGTFSDNTGYVVIYIRHTQRGPLAPPFDQFYAEATPLHTVTIHGVEYAWIYQVPPQMEQSVDAAFGSDIWLRGYEVEQAAVRASGVLSVTVQWQAQAPVPAEYRLFVHVLDSAGNLLGQTDVPPAGPDTPTQQWQPGRVITWVHPVPLSGALPTSGPLWLSFGLYDPHDFTRLPLQQAVPPLHSAPDDGEHALVLPMPPP